MNTAYLSRTWLAMLLAGMFALCHGTTVRPRVLLADRLAPVRIPSLGKGPR